MARVGPSVDSGFPVKAVHSGGSTNQVTVATPATGGASRLIVATLAWQGNSGQVQGPFTVSGMGLSWTNVDRYTRTNYGVETWVAWASSAVGASSVTASPSNGSTGGALMLCVTAFQGTASGSGNVLNAIGSHSGIVSDGSQIHYAQVTLNLASTSSGAVGIFINPTSGGSFSWLANTTADEIDYDTLVVSAQAEGYLNTASSGSTTFGTTFGGYIILAAAGLEILPAPPPTWGGVSPSSGATAGGTALTISGTNFAPTPSVTIGGNSVSDEVWVNSSSVTCTSPVHTVGTVSIVVTNPDGQSCTGTNVYTYNAAPTVTAISPSQGPVTGGTACTITGTGFLASPTVTFGGASATSVVRVNSTTITCNSPVNASGVYAIQVTNTDGQSGTLSNAFKYFPVWGYQSLSTFQGRPVRRRFPGAIEITKPALGIPNAPPDSPTPGICVLGMDKYWPSWNPERSVSVVPTGFMVSGPPMEENWPVYETLNGTGSGSSISVSTPGTRAYDRLIYATVLWYSGNTSPAPTNIVGLGLAWTKIASTATAAPFIKQEGVDIYATWAHKPLDPGPVTVTFTNPGVTYAVLTVYARYDTAGIGVASDAFGATATAADASGATALRSITLNNTQLGSAVVVGVVDGSASTFTTLYNTGFDSLDTTVVTMGSGSLVSPGGGGGLVVGMDGTGAYYAIAAAEILARAQLEKNWDYNGPDMYVRRRWRPFQGGVGKVFKKPAVVWPCPTVSLPDKVVRFQWEPDRSWEVSGGSAPLIQVPTSPVPPMLPERPRLPWNPPRSYHSRTEVVSHMETWAQTEIISPVEPGTTVDTVYVNELFQVKLTVRKPLEGTDYILYITPTCLTASGHPTGLVRFGDIAPQSLPTMPTALSPLGGQPGGAGLLPVTTDSPAVVTWGAVAFKKGTYILGALVTLLDLTVIQALPVSVTVLSKT